MASNVMNRGMGTQNQWHDSPYTLGQSLKSFRQVLLRFWTHLPKSVKEIKKNRQIISTPHFGKVPKVT